MNKNSTIRMIAFVFALLIATQLIPVGVSALGVAPSTQIIEYSNEPIEMEARILNNEHRNFRVALYPQGELANYIAIVTPYINIKETDTEVSFKFLLTPPEGLAPGKRVGGIVIMELPDEFVSNDNTIVTDDSSVIFESKKKDNTMITATQAVIAQVNVNVPYPDTFAEGYLYVSPAGSAGTYEFTASVFNRGVNPFNAKGYVTILDPANNEVGRVDLGSISITEGEQAKISGLWQADVNAGNYKAMAVITYDDKILKIEEDFEVGNLFVEVTNINVKNFRIGTIAKFEIDLLNRWNEPVNNLEGELQILQKGGTIVANFETTTINIPALGQETIYGYWDTENVGIGEYDVNVVLEYEGKTTSKIFETVVGIDDITFNTEFLSGNVIDSQQKGTPYTILIILVAVLIGFNVFLFIMFKKRGGGPRQFLSSSQQPKQLVRGGRDTGTREVERRQTGQRENGSREGGNS